VFSFRFLAELREAELVTIVPHLPAGGTIVEIGGGTGDQALSLQRRGFKMASVDLDSSRYKGHRVFPVVDYDGTHLPFPDRSFDAVYSSNVMEHLADPAPLYAEFRRVLRPGGRCIHVMPSASWRFFSSLTYYWALPRKAFRLVAGIAPGPDEFALPEIDKSSLGLLNLLARRVLPPPHGEKATSFHELARFSSVAWVRHFREYGMKVVAVEPVGIFYTGELALGPRFSIASRRKAARFLGSSCTLYDVRFDA
jgi:SAM-dependent methyltransferase